MVHDAALQLFDAKLAYEIFNSAGKSLGRSLVPALLPASRKLREREWREVTLLAVDFPPPLPSASPSPCLAPVPAAAVRPMLERGSVEIKFDCLLPNFFPKLALNEQPPGYRVKERLSLPSTTHTKLHPSVSSSLLLQSGTRQQERTERGERW
jgi:hypothetical protein